MFRDLQQIENAKILNSENQIVTIGNLNKYTAKIHLDLIESCQIIASGLGEKGFKINFKNTDFLIVTSSNYIFNIQNSSIFRFSNLPEIASLNEILEETAQYIKNPAPTNNIDQTIAFYLQIKILIENAEKYFEINELKHQIYKAALSTDAIGDFSVYE
jgi:hypothetical protein